MRQGENGEIVGVLVINLIVCDSLDDISKIRVLENQNTAGLEQNLQPIGERMQVLNVTNTIRREYHIGLPMSAGDFPRRFQVEESAHPANALALGHGCDVSTRFHAHVTNPQ